MTALTAPMLSFTQFAINPFSFLNLPPAQQPGHQIHTWCDTHTRPETKVRAADKEQRHAPHKASETPEECVGLSRRCPSCPENNDRREEEGISFEHLEEKVNLLFTFKETKWFDKQELTAAGSHRNLIQLK